MTLQIRPIRALITFGFVAMSLITGAAGAAHAGGPPAGRSTPANAIAAGGFHTVINVVDPMACLDQHFNAQHQPTYSVFAWPGPCHDVGNQDWWLDGLTTTMQNRRSGWCLDQISFQSTVVVHHHCHGRNNQRWNFVLDVETGAWQIRNLESGWCLARIGGSITVIAEGCKRNARNQLWLLDQVT